MIGEPEWAKFVRESFQEENREDCIPKPEFKDFWNKVNKLYHEGVKCSCENDEVEGYECCTKCFLPMLREKMKWIWIQPRDKSDRWLCLSWKLRENALDFIDKNGVTGLIIYVQKESKRGKEKMIEINFDFLAEHCSTIKDIQEIEKQVNNMKVKNDIVKG